MTYYGKLFSGCKPVAEALNADNVPGVNCCQPYCSQHLEGNIDTACALNKYVGAVLEINGEDACSPSPPPTAEPTQAPTPPPPTAAPTPAPTPAPTSAPTPAPTPAPVYDYRFDSECCYDTEGANLNTCKDLVVGWSDCPVVGNIIQLTDARGNTFTSTVLNINAGAGTVEFADKIACGKVVIDNCMMDFGKELVFLQGSAPVYDFQYAFKKGLCPTDSDLMGLDCYSLGNTPVVGNILQLIDPAGNTFKSTVLNVNASAGTVQIATKVACGPDFRNCKVDKPWDVKVAFVQGSAPPPPPTSAPAPATAPTPPPADISSLAANGHDSGDHPHEEADHPHAHTHWWLVVLIIILFLIIVVLIGWQVRARLQIDDEEKEEGAEKTVFVVG